MFVVPLFPETRRHNDAVASCLEIALGNKRKFTWQLMKLSSTKVLSILKFLVLVARTP